ncbi:hypothetical protein D3C86_2098200 [compost metagenome]
MDFSLQRVEIQPQTPCASRKLPIAFAQQGLHLINESFHGTEPCPVDQCDGAHRQQQHYACQNQENIANGEEQTAHLALGHDID